MSAQANSSLAKDTVAYLDGISAADSFGSELERHQVRAAVRRLLARVETPYERAWGYCFEHPVVFAALKTGIDLGLWSAWTKQGGGPKSVDDLAKLANATVEINLLRQYPCHASPRSLLTLGV